MELSIDGQSVHFAGVCKDSVKAGTPVGQTDVKQASPETSTSC